MKNILKLKIESTVEKTPHFLTGKTLTIENAVEAFDLRSCYQQLFVYRNKTLGYAIKANERLNSCTFSQTNFMRQVNKLHETGWIDVKEDKIVLCAKPPGSALEWLARVAD